MDFSSISSLSTYEIDHKLPFARHPSTETQFSKMSAMLEFKYSEENVIDREFPYLDASNVEDDIIVVENQSQNTYFFAIDSFDTLNNLSTFKMDVFVPNAVDPSAAKYSSEKIVPTLPKYRDFYNKSLTIEATYNLEKISPTPPDGQQQYEIVQYFNYKNFTDPQYVRNNDRIRSF